MQSRRVMPDLARLVRLGEAHRRRESAKRRGSSGKRSLTSSCGREPCARTCSDRIGTSGATGGCRVRPSPSITKPVKRNSYASKHVLHFGHPASAYTLYRVKHIGSGSSLPAQLAAAGCALIPACWSDQIKQSSCTCCHVSMSATEGAAAFYCFISVSGLLPWDWGGSHIFPRIAFALPGTWVLLRILKPLSPCNIPFGILSLQSNIITCPSGVYQQKDGNTLCTFLTIFC